ncbi:ABC transporter permease subunit [Haloglycomyces albus]|uniref:ABC transporter permease subunit n=1 Tax=Haloglycomyces albus TaxID=526067 RepID=UPI00046D3FC6|nr:ABC transporter permease subunit [Haloglycomyces albus]
MNLFLAELRRITHRRLTWVFMILALGIVLLVSGLTALTSQAEPTASQRAEAERMWENDQQRIEECEENPPTEQTDPHSGEAVQEPCEHMGYSDDKEDYYDLVISTFNFSENAPGYILPLTVIAGLLMLILASSLIGAEWRSGGISNLLLWHPNRMQVFYSKLAAALTVTVVALTAFIAVVFLALYAAAALQGEIGTLDGEWWSDLLAGTVRAVVLGLFMTMFGTTITYLGRHTAIAGGIVAALLILNTMLVGFAALALQVKYPELWSVTIWTQAWLDGEVTLQHWPDTGPFEPGPVKAEEMTLTYGSVGIGMLIVTGVLLAISSFSFSKRDIS